MTTLADLTEEERKACVGMWADYSATLVVITYVYWYEYSQGFSLTYCTPQRGMRKPKSTSHVSLHALTCPAPGTRTVRQHAEAPLVLRKSPMADQHRPRVWKAGHNCWAVTDDYFCEELNQRMYTTRLLRTWQQAINHATQKENQ